MQAEIFRLPFSDTQSGFKIFKRKALEDVMLRLMVKRYTFDVELLVNIHRKATGLRRHPFKVEHEKNRTNIKRIYRTAIDTLAVFYRLHLTKTYD